MSHRWKLFLAAALLLGGVLRLLWGMDIEYKRDERYMFEQTRRYPVSGAFPWIGMESGIGIPNPGMSVWAFLALSRVFPSRTPPELARAVQITNIIAIGGLLLLALRLIDAGERTAWLWAVALASVNPVAVLLHRKMWAQSLLPLFCVLLLASWLRRDRPLGAFGWGFLGALLGQIHMSGFFFAASLWLWTILFGSNLRQPRPPRWTAWGIGSAAAALPLVPWAHAVLLDSAAFHRLTASLSWPQPRLLWQFWGLWLTDGLGLGLDYSLGNAEFGRFLKHPLVAGHFTYLIGLIHAFIVVLAFVCGVEALRSFRSGSFRWKHLLAGDGSETSLLLAAALGGYGLLLTLTGIEVFRHYLLVTFPLEWVGLAFVAARRSRTTYVLLALWFCQLALSIGFLSYIHVYGGAPTGDYGVAYSRQR